MLIKLVEEIRNGGTLETGLLAEHLGTTPQLVQAMLEYLQRSGMIQPFINCDTTACQACGLKGGCTRQTSVRLWQSKTEG